MMKMNNMSCAKWIDMQKDGKQLLTPTLTAEILTILVAIVVKNH
jgi:hypothetical protein